MLRFIAAAGLCLALAACATPYTPTPFDRETAAVESIAVLDDTLPERPNVTQVASAGSSFGLIGALIDAGVDANREGRFKEMLEENGFEPTPVFEAALRKYLMEKGYAIDFIDTPERSSTRDLLASYENLESGADAYLDIATEIYGYLSAGAGQPWRPTFICEVRLVSSADGATLMQNAIVYNPLNPREGVVTITPDPSYNFRNIKEIEENPEKAIAGMREAMTRVAETIASVLN